MIFRPNRARVIGCLGGDTVEGFLALLVDDDMSHKPEDVTGKHLFTEYEEGISSCIGVWVLCIIGVYNITILSA